MPFIADNAIPSLQQIIESTSAYALGVSSLLADAKIVRYQKGEVGLVECSFGG